MEVQKLVLDYVRTIAIVVGIIFALVELNNATRQLGFQKHATTSAMLARFGEPAMLQALDALVEARVVEPTEAKFFEITNKTTPIRQHLITWAACLAEEICLDGATRQVFCDRLRSYEKAIEDIYKHFKKPFDKMARDAQLFGQREKCNADFPSDIFQ